MASDHGENRGRELARTLTIERIGRLWRVPSRSSATDYWVDVEQATCTCPEYEFTARPCKHVHCVFYVIARGRADVANDEQPVTSAPAAAAHRVHERDVFEQLLRDLCAGIVEPQPRQEPRRSGRSLRGAAFSAILKSYLGQSSRRVQPDLRACVERGRLAGTGGVGSISYFLGDQASTPLLEALAAESAAPLHLLEEARRSLDSAGVAAVTYDRWFDRRPWTRVRVAMGTSTHAVLSTKVSAEVDCPLLLPRGEQRSENFHCGQWSKGKVHGSVRDSKIVEEFGLSPYIPLRSSAAMNLRSSGWSRYLGAFLFDRDRFLVHYHRRSTVEEVVPLLKHAFGAALSSRRPIAQINETLAKVVAHNLSATCRAIFAAGLAPRLSPGTPMLALVR